MYSRTSRTFVGLIGLACCTVSAILVPSVGTSAGWSSVQSYKQAETPSPQKPAPVSPFQNTVLVIRNNEDLFDTEPFCSLKEDKRKPRPFPEHPLKPLCSAIIFVRYEQDAVHKPPWDSLIV